MGYMFDRPKPLVFGCLASQSSPVVAGPFLGKLVSFGVLPVFHTVTGAEPVLSAHLQSRRQEFYRNRRHIGYVCTGALNFHA